ncbi:MAG: ATP synthase F1 subunit epsilon [Alphaproteobacteria bacterium]|jgi:F-type H+-transporting ATPase subunit epsilon|uniref:ATP synthase epsilon chain n=1 Tax=PS1 clade bacterium TaxID=2175152 RepID=A0A368DRZ7_9PROT|nr:ATP synthase F1 subunit epsilon [Rhodobiaceae bacterium]OUT74806.1 MAG: ATP synthase F1 subunit epsilon [Rhizobiales bacterium TMED25]RCL74612.1 MAG: ATP synthase F1 subunit epsilon [PS1 clade bacterium]|tara:strand:- start:2360 stop:2758 length:399 start_codon:yes stop_codon:yes gene_type:complete
MDKFKFEFVTPEKLLFSSEVEQVIIPGSEGEFTILAEHSPIISSMKAGLIRIYSDINSVPVVYFVTEGFIDMASNSLTILAQNAIEKDLLDDQKLVSLIDEYQMEIDNTDSDIRKNKYNMKIENIKAIQSDI